jgi:hypothetical protein
MDNTKRDILIKELDEALSLFSETMNKQNSEYSRSGYNEDAIIMFDELAKHTYYLASSFRDAILKALS